MTNSFKQKITQSTIFFTKQIFKSNYLLLASWSSELAGRIGEQKAVQNQPSHDCASSEQGFLVKHQLIKQNLLRFCQSLPVHAADYINLLSSLFGGFLLTTLSEPLLGSLTLTSAGISLQFGFEPLMCFLACFSSPTYGRLARPLALGQASLARLVLAASEESRSCRLQSLDSCVSPFISFIKRCIFANKLQKEVECNHVKSSILKSELRCCATSPPDLRMRASGGRVALSTLAVGGGDHVPIVSLTPSPVFIPHSPFQQHLK